MLASAGGLKPTPVLSQEGDFLQLKLCAGKKGSFKGCQERRDKLNVQGIFGR